MKKLTRQPGDGLKIPDQDPRFRVQAWHDTDPGVADGGVTYIHCARCLDEWKADYQGICSPKQYARQQVALTDDGIQVWCTRHDINITTLILRAAVKEGVDENKLQRRRDRSSV